MDTLLTILLWLGLTIIIPFIFFFLAGIMALVGSSLEHWFRSDKRSD